MRHCLQCAEIRKLTSRDSASSKGKSLRVVVGEDIKDFIERCMLFKFKQINTNQLCTSAYSHIMSSCSLTTKMIES